MVVGVISLSPDLVMEIRIPRSSAWVDNSLLFMLRAFCPVPRVP